MALSDNERRRLVEALAKSMQGDRITDAATTDFLLYGGYEPLSIQITHILFVLSVPAVVWTLPVLNLFSRNYDYDLTITSCKI
jgi:hypothetical protein